MPSLNPTSNRRANSKSRRRVRSASASSAEPGNTAPSGSSSAEAPVIVQALKTCSQCAVQVARNQCHRNRYGQYICHTCLEKLAGRGGSARSADVQRQPATKSYAEAPAPAPRPATGRQLFKRNKNNLKSFRRGRSVPSAGSNDVIERVFQWVTQVAVVLFLALAVWYIWSQM